MDLELGGKTAIVTGASQGIGEAIAVELAREGVRVVLAARNEANLERVAGRISELGGEALVLPLDLTDPEAPAEMIARSIDRFGAVDILVNNAGATKRGDFLQLTDQDFADGFALKFYACMRSCRAAWPHLMASQGSIVNIIGIGAKTPSRDFTIGGSVNSAILNFTKALADRGVSDRVKVNAIHPGYIKTTRLTDRLDAVSAETGRSRAELESEMLQKTGIPRFGQPEEIGQLTAWLCSPRSAYMQGAAVDIDGGVTRGI